jgi:hypothetical protein
LLYCRGPIDEDDEWLNVSVRGSWSYSALMPVIPIIGTGLSALMQWIVVPLLAFWVARHLQGSAARNGSANSRRTRPGGYLPVSTRR